ncbi:MAG: PQQ-binding-like beta-propeller repeat protein [Planctomycetota bacterium]|nr:PQQ-binding-like beta-propeller repeat protein [Planctomycetota bacterium]
MSTTIRSVGLVACLGICLGAGALDGAAPPSVATPAEQALARRILEATGVKGGLIVHVGCGDGKLTAALRASDGYLVHGLDADARNVESARRQVQSAGLYGTVSIDRLADKRLPYVEDLVNLVVVEAPGLVPADEVMRVLAPEGVAYVRSGSEWTKTVKPRPKEIDEWTHYLHDPGNNAVAHDARVGPPRHLQWVGAPMWARHHDHMASMSALVSAGGRIFYIMDEGPREAILLPAKWMLVARDAFNGAILWKRAIAEWNTQLWPLKSGPNQLPRRLVAVGDRVYVTLGIDAPLTVLDAATGKTIRTCEGTPYTEEILASDGVLFLLVAQSPNKWKEYRPKSTFVWDNPTRANKEWAWDQATRFVLAIQADTGAVLWKKERRVAPLTLAVDRERVFFHDGEKAVALARKTGAEVWASEPIVRKTPLPTGYGPTLVVQDGVVLVSVENTSMTALAAADGKKLWQAPHHRGGHASPDDLLVVGGLVWSGAIAAGADSGVLTGRDLKTGEVKSEFLPDVKAYWFHHRCYRSRATDRYFISSRTGLEFIDLEAKHWDINHWVRGGCLYGIMPANGLVYAPPHACGCYLESKLAGFYALAAESPGRKVPAEVPDAGRLERGPAYEEPVVAAATAGPDEWPTSRHDAARSGSVRTPVPVDLKRVWQAELGGRLSSVTVAGDKVFVAAVDAHTMHALDAGSGKPAWSFTAGSRVDSPPTLHQGRVLFGSADGWVYCLRAADGHLIWRFRVAPQDRRVMAMEQLESAWPVSGSVLVQNDAVYCVAGRSAFLDGGMRMVRLDPKTGRRLSETLLDDRDPETGGNLQMQMSGLDMPVALPDILSCDGRQVYMRAQAFNLEGVRQGVAPVKGTEQGGEGAHLFSRSGFLDDSWFFRSYWMYGRGVDSGYGAWFRPGHLAPSGRLMVFDETRIYGFDRKPEYLCNASVQEYYLYAAEREVREESVKRVLAATGRINAASRSKSASSSDWATRKKFTLSEQSAAGFTWAEGNPPIQARAMVLAGQTLFVAGPPDVADEEESLAKPDDPAVRARLEAQTAALQGRKGGQLLAFAAADGKKLAAVELGAMPTFDGMAAARGRLYLSTTDGKVLCLGGEGAGLPAAPDAPLAPLDTSIKAVAEPAPAPADGPSAKGEFAKLTQARVTRSEMGYRLAADGRKMGLALRQLATPLKGTVHLKVRLKSGADGAMQNGFLVFGDGLDDDALVKCGLRFLTKKAVIVEGPITGGKTTAGDCDLDAAKVHEIDVTVNLASGQVTMKVGGVTVTAALTRRPAGLSCVGYGVLGAVAEFSPIETSAD